jgi:hypothetical protein
MTCIRHTHTHTVHSRTSTSPVSMTSAANVGRELAATLEAADLQRITANEENPNPNPNC